MNALTFALAKRLDVWSAHISDGCPVTAPNPFPSLFLRETHLKVLRVLEQAEALTQRYHVVVANPPYMGIGGMNPTLKMFVERQYPEGKSDLYGCFILRLLELVVPKGAAGLITIPNWMFLEGFADLRRRLLDLAFISSLIQNGRGLWGADFGSCSFCFTKGSRPNSSGVFRRLFGGASEVSSPDELNARYFDQAAFPIFRASAEEFRAIPGAPIAFWIRPELRRAFVQGRKIEDVADAKIGLQTGDNERFVRRWQEVSSSDAAFENRADTFSGSPEKWFPYNKGGQFRKWYGNQEFVVNWQSNGSEVRGFTDLNGKPRSYPRNMQFYFLPSISWSKVSIGAAAFRSFPRGFIFDHAGCSLFPKEPDQAMSLIGFLNSKVMSAVLAFLSPTMNYEVGHVSRLPILQFDLDRVSKLTTELVESARQDWDNFETSWDFQDFPLLRDEKSGNREQRTGISQNLQTTEPSPLTPDSFSLGLKGATLEASWRNWEAQSTAAIRRMQELETENNRLFIAAYGLGGELQPEVPEAQITLARAEARRDMAAFLSYAVGCMMGRYSLDKPGLVYADSRSIGFDPSQYLTFAADADGIVPVTELAWFSDDATERVIEFLTKTFASDTLEANLKFIAEALVPTKDETPRDTVRRYLAAGFYKDHLQTYKRRPIYWLFSSGKQRAFQCLVYLHRYNEGTLARMRTEYVIPLQGKISHRIDQLAGDITAATSTSHRKKLEKERESLVKQATELAAFDEKLRHYADQRIALDLDDGVKVNYAKFGDLLAEVKAVTGGSEE